MRAWALLLPLPLLLGAAREVPPASRSGFDVMTPALQAMQRNDAQNPAMLWTANGATLWKAEPPNGRPSCAGCHASGLAGAAARFPAFSEALQRPVTLNQQINRCRTEHQEQPAWTSENDALLALSAYIGQQSRGLPIAPPKDSRLEDWRRAGEALYRQRMGQLHLSCAQCHEERAGQRLAGAVIPSGLATGYPIYRLEWQGMGSLQRRLRNCTTGVRAQPLGEDALTQVELYLMQRAEGLKLETPAVRP
ncbi:sulfur oxidation c-type cytochrome SoxA [Roseateles amylovorans]|jgi:L-cysteine S-thiosulfotransferase|uniref:L-cysteine S-thiosulfotransferase subunit SoxA n=1 Tax=Roseateles amylovorans TaxID=2978473 RepID=A0ABY6B202_9BURK|nr:sulfur oxidation c-type cytochrome SoxA [Roseateles amylovorans]UXH78231.1 sulfur oxidation c-type cytochrome SoxA [Roseateles amylovorans]